MLGPAWAAGNGLGFRLSESRQAARIVALTSSSPGDDPPRISCVIVIEALPRSVSSTETCSWSPKRAGRW